MKTKWMPLILAACCLAGLVVESPARTNEDQIGFQHFEEPIFPVVLKAEGIYSGFAEIIVDINEDGTVADWLPIRCNHPYFIDSVGYVVDDWIFEPKMENGEPVPAVRYLTINFSHEGIVLYSGNLTDMYLNRLTRDHQVFNEVAKLSELDQLPEPIHIVPPRLPSDIPKEELTGEVTVTFFIDEEGKVRIPIVTDINAHLGLAGAAYHAIKDWRFKAPMVHGEKVVVKARQPFHFEPPEVEVQD